MVRMVRAVLFDLDDTLFDHAGCARCALEAVYRAVALNGIGFDEFARLHARILEELHRDVLAGFRTIDEAREERFRRLLTEAGGAGTAALARDAAVKYRDQYVAERRAIEGAADLLAAVRARALVGIVTNNLTDEQREKLRTCGLEGHVDVLLASEEAGVSKPDPAIFRMALDRLACDPSEAVMVGDSWAADVAGARAAGILPIWFNPGGAPALEPGVPILRALTPVEPALQTIFDAHRR
jgi:HAD superfamily hydrolase (TIGR01549 family)